MNGNLTKQTVDFDKPFTENYKKVVFEIKDIKDTIITRCGITQYQWESYMYGKAKIPKLVNEVANDVIRAKIIELSK